MIIIIILTRYRMSIREVNSDDIVLDINGDDSESIKRKRTVVQWDRKKKKYIKVSGVDPRKKLLNESGKVISEKEKLKAGKM